MTGKQKAFLKNLPKCNNNVKEAALKAGYSESYASSTLYQDIRNPKSRLAPYIDNDDKICGVVTIEDLLEEIFGEIEDEFDLDK